MKRCLVLLPVALAACHKAPSVTADNASVNEVAAKVAASGGGPVALTPGRYAMTYAINKVDIPAMPAAAKSMQQAMGKGTATSICLTEEQAKKPAASLFAGQNAKNCTYDHFAMSKGAIDATMTCKAGPTVATSSMKGDFSADGFHMDVTTASKGGPGQPMGDMTMAATIDAKRTGACTGKEAG